MKITSYKCNASPWVFFGMSLAFSVGMFLTFGLIAPFYFFWAVKYLIENTEQITYSRDA